MSQFLIILIAILSIATTINIIVKQKRGVQEVHLIMLENGLHFLKRITYFFLLYQIVILLYNRYLGITENYLDTYLRLGAVLVIIFKVFILMINRLLATKKI